MTKLGRWEHIAAFVANNLTPEFARMLCIQIAVSQPGIEMDKAIRVIGGLFDEGQNGERKDVRTSEEA